MTENNDRVRQKKDMSEKNQGLWHWGEERGGSRHSFDM